MNCEQRRAYLASAACTDLQTPGINTFRSVRLSKYHPLACDHGGRRREALDIASRALAPLVESHAPPGAVIVLMPVPSSTNTLIASPSLAMRVGFSSGRELYRLFMP
jgi:hypothetical protein